MSSKKFVLIIMDGWGHGDKTKSDAIYMANTPFIDSLYKKYPNAELITCGEEVGLPEGQMGNSEVGHLNIGAGRVVYQDLVKINLEVKNKDIKYYIAKNMIQLHHLYSYAFKCLIRNI
jgi:2,3-bisphosphoglycerate-independent phosphoglycerate mutase